MGKKTRLLAALAAVALAVSGSIPAQAEETEYLSKITAKDKDDWVILTSETPQLPLRSSLSLQPGGVGLGETRGEWYNCSSLADPKCTSPAAYKQMLGWSILPDCTTTQSVVCIEQFSVGKVGTPLEPALYKTAGSDDREVTTFPGDPSKNLLDGAATPIYSQGSTNYAVAVRASQFWNATTNKFYVESLEARITPLMASTNPNICPYKVDGQCTSITNFTPDTRLNVKFRIPNELGGWFSGRMKAPDVKVEKFDEKTNLVTIESEPVTVAAMGLVKSEKDFSAKEKMWQQNNGYGGTAAGRTTGANTWQEDVFEFIEFYRNSVKDTSVGTDTIWNMRTIGSGGGSRCLSDKSKVLGIVTTNALGYDGGSPKFSGGFLNYKVGGLHHLPNGKDLVLGVYDLVMRSETARCLYGFSNAPLSATVSVTGGAGGKNVATTVVSEKNGWLKMAAYGFTFSNKTIKVKITKKAFKPKAKPAPKKR
jgi:hypothetical protein